MTTAGSNGARAPCVFPFKYKQKYYYECVTFEDRNPWCATTFDYDADNKWGYCADIKCFRLVEDKKIFNDARGFCKSDGASLASVHNEYEQGES